MSLLTQFYNGGTSGSTTASDIILSGLYAGNAPGVPPCVYVTIGSVAQTLGLTKQGNGAVSANPAALSYSTGKYGRIQPALDVSLTVDSLSKGTLSFFNLDLNLSVNFTLDAGPCTGITGLTISQTGGLTLINGSSAVTLITGRMFSSTGRITITSSTMSSLADLTNFYFLGSVNNSFICSFTNAALSADSVNHLLINIDTDVTTTGGSKSINLSGGTSAGVSLLSAAGLAARNSLVAKGYTVTLNA